MARAILEQARTSILVADQGKLKRAAPVRIASLGALDIWVTDSDPQIGRASCRERV